MYTYVIQSDKVLQPARVEERSEEEAELLRIYGKLSVRKRHRLMALAFELDGVS